MSRFRNTCVLLVLTALHVGVRPAAAQETMTAFSGSSMVAVDQPDARSPRASERHGVRPLSGWLAKALNSTVGPAMFRVNDAMPMQFMIVDQIDIMVPGNPTFQIDVGADPLDWLSDVIGDAPAESTGETVQQPPQVERDAAKLGMDPLTLDFNRTLQDHLAEEAAKIGGDRDAAGNLLYDYGSLNPFDDNPVFDERPVSRPVVEGLVLKREHVTTMFESFATQLEGIQKLPDHERLTIAKGLLDKADELQDARVNMIANQPSQYDRYGRPVFRDAEDNAAYNYRRGVYFDLLGDNPLLAIYGDFTVLGGDEYFHERLYHDFYAGRQQPRTAEERQAYDDDLLSLFDTALGEGISNARDEADRIEGLNTFEDLLELAGPEYAMADQQLRANSESLGSDYVDGLLDSVEGELGTIKAIDAPKQLFISTTLAAGAVITSFVVPGSGGVVLTVVLSATDVGIEGTKLWKLEGQLDRQQEAGAVLGFDNMADIEDATDEQKKMTYMAAAFGLIDAASLTQLGKSSRAAAAAEEAGEAADAARAFEEAPTVIDRAPRADRGPRTERIAGGASEAVGDAGGLTDDQLAFWRNRPTEIGNPDEARIGRMDDLVRAARADASDIPHETIDEALDLIEQRAASDPTYGAMEALDDLEARLGVAEMDAEGHVLVVRNQRELEEFAETTGGAVPRNVREMDTNGLSELKTKASIAASGRPTNWTAADRQLAQEVLGDEDYFLHTYDWISDESGVQQIFTEDDLADLRKAFPEYVQGGADEAAGLGGALDETPTVLDRPRPGQDETPTVLDRPRPGQDETPTVLDRPRQIDPDETPTVRDRPGRDLENDRAFREAPTERDFSVEDETPTVIERANPRRGVSVDEDGEVTLDLGEVGWKLPGLAGQIIQVGNGAKDEEQPPVLEAYVTSDGGSTGSVMSLNVLNQGKPLRLKGDGLVFEPAEVSDEESQALLDRLGDLGANLVSQQLSAYCVQFFADVPVAGTVFQLAPPDAQQAYAGMRKVLSASNGVREELNPDSDPQGYFDSTRQWAIWTHERSLNAEQFEEAFLTHTRKNVEAAGREWTSQIEEVVRKLVPNRWADVQKVLNEADTAP